LKSFRGAAPTYLERPVLRELGGGLDGRGIGDDGARHGCDAGATRDGLAATKAERGLGLDRQDAGVHHDGDLEIFLWCRGKG
jgi:hypothetical protein